MRHFGLITKLTKGSLIYIDTYYGKYTYEVYDYEILKTVNIRIRLKDNRKKLIL